ncbi:uncharacterized protein G2W53_008046 [Senna tora]|uniref:ATP-dependent DNA helicase n=1 Tax=Senna tora TaxID=362788 RepID=A0A835CEV1_9FABA|nr:uncharacterized protein G2W53_008046 [Senna tora]
MSDQVAPKPIVETVLKKEEEKMEKPSSPNTSSLECNNPFTNIDFMDSHTNMQSPSKSFGSGAITSGGVNEINANIQSQSSLPIAAITSEGVNEINVNIQSQSSLPRTPGPFSFRIRGQNYHLIGSLLPLDGVKPKFAQLYIYDTENEVRNRMSAFSTAQKDNGLNSHIVLKLKDMLDQYNPFVKSFRMAADQVRSSHGRDVQLWLLRKRDKDGRMYNFYQHQSELHPSYLPLQYPLLFPFGEDGYRDNISHTDPYVTDLTKMTRVTLREFFKFRLKDRDNEISILMHFGRLLQQFIVDGFTMVESQRLNFVQMHQKQLRMDLYNGLINAILRGDHDATSIGKRIILPSSFTGGPRYMAQSFHDGIQICKWAGYPDLFLTFTCNTNWPEIQRFVRKKQLRAEDRPDIVCRVFKIKLNQLISVLKEKQFFGRVITMMYTIEFQKRALPHAHILLFKAPRNKYPTPEDIDKIICAKIPDRATNPELYAIMQKFMIHGPCGASNYNSPCMVDGRYSKNFPKKFVDRTTVDENGYPLYRRRDDGRTIEKNGINLDNRFVVPNNPQLLMLFNAHINVELCNQSCAIKYLFKLLAVERLSFHFPNQQPIIFQDGDSLDSIISKPTIHETMFTTWMQANKDYPEARELTYTEFLTKFFFHASEKKWKPRENGFSIGRLHQVPPTSGELFYARILLNKVRGPTCFEDIRTIGNIVHPTYRDACYALGLLDDDKEFIEAIHEASHWGSGQYLRSLFVTMLLSNTISRPDIVWEKCWDILSEDARYTQRRDIQFLELQVSDMELRNFALTEIDKLLRNNGRTLMDIPPLLAPNGNSISNLQNRVILDQLNFDKEDGVFFVHGYGGTSKTYIWIALTATLRVAGHIVLIVASSAIASILLPSGRTAHSRFAIPLLINEDSTCNINQGSPIAELIRKTKLIIWDEVVMMNKYYFEAVNKSLRDILQLDNLNSLNIPFGGKAIVLAGDFRQILAVIPQGTRSDIVFSALNSSYLWNCCKVLNLTQNMRLRSQSSSHNEDEVKEFADWLLNVGEGKVNEPNDGEVEIEIPNELFITDFSDPIGAIISSTYPSLQENYINAKYLKDRAILAPTLEIVEEVNQHILSQLPSEERIYLSSDSISNSCQDSQSLDDLYTPDFLNTINCSGLPPHKLTLKIDAPIMLLRNIDQSSGRCNGTRLIVSQLGNHFIEAKVINGSHYGQKTGIFVTLATILKIQTNFGWFYESCNKCMKEIRNENGLLLCPSCNKTSPVIILRFKIHVQVIDYTENATFVLFDCQVYQVFQKIAKELRDQLTEEGQEYSFLEELEFIVTKMFAFKFEMTEFNLSCNQSSYSVRSLTDDINIINELKNVQSSIRNIMHKKMITTLEVAFVISENETDHCLTSNITPSKRVSPDDVQTVGLAEMHTPQMSSTKPIKQIKKKKFE